MKFTRKKAVNSDSFRESYWTDDSKGDVREDLLINARNLVQMIVCSES